MKDHELQVTVPARLLDELSALAGGYTMSRGQWINPNYVRGEAYSILHEAGYEYGLDTQLISFEGES